jgi:dTDP-4-dehydrorhamnose reductase
MNILVIGGEGQLGSDFLRIADSYGFSGQGIDLPEIDISSRASIFDCLPKYNFDVLINTAAYHGYKAYEDTDPQKYYAINVFGPYYLSEYAKLHSKVLVHYSTDYVFSGNDLQKEKSFSEEDIAYPANLYAASKLAGEQIIQASMREYFIFRIASIYGTKGCKAKNWSNFVEMAIKKMEAGTRFDVVDDIYMSPTSTISIVKKTFDILKSNKYGLYNLAGSGSCSWYDFAIKIAEYTNLNRNLITRSSSKKIHQEITRGSNTSLLNKKLINEGFTDIPRWEQNLQEYITIRNV